MSVYLGQDKVGVSYLTKTNIYEDNRSIMQDDVYTPWVRPEGWPDLDSLNLEMSGEESFIYMTYQTGHVDDVCSFHVNTTTGGATVEIGTTANSTETINNGNERTYWFTENEGYNEGTIVIKVTGHLSRFYLVNITRDNNMGGTINYYMQPMLERIWYVPDLISFNSGTTTSANGNGTYTIERDKIGNGAGTALTSTYYAWYNCYRLQSLDISNLLTPNVTTMSCMFEYCRQLEYIDVTDLNTAKATSISYMFDGCFLLKELDLSNWDTQKLTGGGLSYIFRNCYALKQIIGLNNIYTNNLTSLISIFNNCYSLEDLSEIINWNISKVTNLGGLFSSCYKIKSLDLSRWDVSRVTTVGSMFYYCYSLEHIKFPQVQTNTLSGSQASIFNGCWGLQEVDLSWIKPITSAVTSIGYMFSNCRSLKEINIPEGWDLTNCIISESCYRIFSDCYMLEKVTGTKNWDMSGYNYSLANMFQNDYCLKEIEFSNWNPHPTSLYYAFYNCYSLEKIDLSTWHFENLTGNGVSCMFTSCHSLKEIKGIEHLCDAGNINNLSSMFASCYSLTSIPNINSWDISKVTTCASMFDSCRSLQSLTITNWTLTKCTTIAGMFRYCYNLRELELTGWSLPALTTNPDYIFCQLYSLVKCSGLPIPLNHRYQEAYQLPEDQWVRIFNQLPTVSSKTLYMTTVNINRLTAATKAIATNKGWTLAN